MEYDNDINSNGTEAPDDSGRIPERFFRRYLPPQSAETGNSKEALSQECVPPDLESYESAASQSTNDAVSLSNSAGLPESDSRARPTHRSPAFIWGGLAFITMIFLLLTVWQTVLQKKAQPITQSDTREPSTHQSDAGGTESTTSDSDISTTPPAITKDFPAGNRSRIQPLMRVAPSSAKALLLDRMLSRAREFESRGMLDLAAREYRAILIPFPDDQTSRSGLNRIQIILSDRRRDDTSRLSREAGLREFRFGNYAAAKTHLIAAVNAGRIDTATLYALGMSNIRLGNYADAQAALGKCIAASPNYAPALVGLAQAHIGLKENDKALPLLKRALELGGGAEFTTVKIEEMISGIVTAGAAITPPRKPMFFLAYGVHRHSIPLLWCRGEVTITDSYIRFNSNKPSHSFYVSSSKISGVRTSGNTVYFSLDGKPYTLVIEGRSARDFITVLNQQQVKLQPPAGDND